MPCFIGSQSYIFFMCDLSDLATRGRDGWNVCMCSGLPVDSSRRKLTFAAETPELEQSRKVLKIFFLPSFGFIQAFPSAIIEKREKKHLEMETPWPCTPMFRVHGHNCMACRVDNERHLWTHAHLTGVNDHITCEAAGLAKARVTSCTCKEIAVVCSCWKEGKKTCTKKKKCFSWTYQLISECDKPSVQIKYMNYIGTWALVLFNQN